MIHVFSLIVVGLGLLYFGLLVMLWAFQERVVFQPPSRVAPADVDARRVEYRTADGVELFAYIVGDCSTASTVLLAFHGNADLARWFVPWAKRVLRETGACVVLPEYRGYDGLTPSPTYATSAYDARAAYDYVRNALGASPERVVFFGHSLGTAIATELASVAAPRALVLQAPFSTARAMGARMFLPGLTAFWRFVSRVHFDTLERVRTLNVPVWVSHGDKDLVIPVRMGREVFSAAAVKGELLIVPGAGHNDVAEVGGRDYWDWLRRAVIGTR
ncbi:MAG TPA: alpha/beta hydrolase [Gemmatimonadaceae bacterium]